MDKLSIVLNDTAIGGQLLNHLYYADDMCLISISSSGMQQLLNFCDSFSIEHLLYCIMEPSHTYNFWGRKVKKRYKEVEKWMGREVVVPVNKFSRGDIFSGGVEIFSGGVVEKFSRGSHVRTPPPGNLLLFFENRRGRKKTDGG